MSSTKRKWLIACVLLVGISAISLVLIASILSQRFEPYIRDEAIRYLQERFDSEVELGALKVHLPRTSTLRMLVTRGRGAVAEVEGSNLSLRHSGRRDMPPMFAINPFRFAVDLGRLFEPPQAVPLVEL